MEFFERMGRGIHAAWRRRNFDEDAFPELALAALQASPPADSVTYADVVRAWVFAGEVPRNISSEHFGQPAITVFAHERFYIEVLCWMDASTAVHQHGFSGAFHVMAGSSLHTTYRFAPGERIDSQMLLGEVVHERSELLTRGASRMIRAGAGFIHSLFHLDRPSISVVVRTARESDRLPQWEYFPPYLALDSTHGEERRRRRLTQTLDMLFSTDPPGYDQLVDRLVAESDLSLIHATLLHTLQQASGGPGAIAAERVTAIRTALRARFGAVADRLESSCRELLRASELVRRRDEILDRDLRFFVALLIHVPTRAAVLELVEEYTGRDPLAQVWEWVQALTRVHGVHTLQLLELELEVEPPRPAVPLDVLLHAVLRAMLAGARGDGVIAAIVGDLPDRGLEPFADSIRALEATLRAGGLRALFVDGGAAAVA